MARRKNSINEPKTEKAIILLPCPSYDEAIEIFIKEQKIKNRTPRTFQWHRENFHILKKAFDEQSIPLDLPSITAHHIKYNFILYSLEKWSNKPSTVNNRLKTYRSFWRFLTKEKYLSQDITLSIENLNEKKVVIVTLDETEIKAMLKSCDRKTFTGLRDHLIMSILLDTGIRLKELVALKTGDILWNENLVKIVEGKCMKERYVPLSKELKSNLRV